ncbi:MAG TPA: hypothetical protein PK978_03060 [Paludibacter sp.]|nr:hypothetical protein [Paludibacter sp.]HOS45480.1 hypothetical protein [Paludibacter sp.]HPM09026.1 hypothetical protein [Paludibacter sp.]
MKYLFMKASLFNHNNSVFYVETEFQPELNRFIRKNYSKLVKLFNSSNLNFYYLPILLKDKRYWKIVHYNRPYVQPVSVTDEIQQVYDILIKRQGTEVIKGALLLSSGTEFPDSLPVFTLIEKDASLKSFKNMSHKISDCFDRLKDSQVRFRTVVSDEKKYLHDISMNEMFESLVEETAEDVTSYEETVLFSTISTISTIRDADTKFETEAFRLADEIRERLELLKEYGALSLIGDVIEEIQQTKNKISSLFITNDYRIFLKDYGMKEVVMSPLPKSLFLLFLNHPEGILFKELSNHHDELLSIYRNITLRENIDAVMESIKAMTDPLNNSVNEKCSRIRSAFLEVITDDLAKNYYITGKRGEPKKITLNRELVSFQ